MRRTRWIVAASLLASTGLAACETGPRIFRSRAELVVEPRICVERRFPIYFDEGRAGLSRPARQMIAATARELKGCDIRRVQVLGLADATGDAASNQALSERRARTVAQAFQRAGWPVPAFEAAAAGDAGAVTREGAVEPMRRRTEVIVTAAPAPAR